MKKQKENPRNYNCKDEELPVIGGYVLTSIRRDQAKFEEYSPIYNNEGIAAFEKEITAIDELVNPKSEIAESKLVTARLYSTMDRIFDTALRIEGYIGMSKGAVPISAKDFGIAALKLRAHAKDAEGTIKNARLVLANMKKYQEPLTEFGLTDAMINGLAADIASVSADNRLQYDRAKNLNAIVTANLDMMNGVAGKIKEICKNGKILFRGNAEKLKEYTWAQLMKRVRNIPTPPKKTENKDESDDQPAE